MTKDDTSDRPSSPVRGALCMVVGGGLLTANDAVLKWLTEGYPIGQLMFIRGLFIFIPIGLLAWRAGGIHALRVQTARGPLTRAALVVCGTFLFIAGLSYLPLADAIAITFAGPLFLTALAPALLGERVGWRRWSAVLIGFLGVLVMVRPTGEAIQWAALLPLGASLTGALRDIVTRRLSFREKSVALLFYTTLAVVLAGLATSPMGWSPVGGSDLALFGLAGLLVGSAQFLLIEAFRLAEATLVAPFKYTNLVWAVLLGFIVFDHLPDGWTLGGSAFVIGGGLYILHRETLARRRGRRKDRLG